MDGIWDYGWYLWSQNLYDACALGRSSASHSSHCSDSGGSHALYWFQFSLKKIFDFESRITKSNSERFASELLENTENMFPLYHTHSDVYISFRNDRVYLYICQGIVVIIIIYTIESLKVWPYVKCIMFSKKEM